MYKGPKQKKITPVFGRQTDVTMNAWDHNCFAADDSHIINDNNNIIK